MGSPAGSNAARLALTSPIWLGGLGGQSCPPLMLQNVWLHVPSAESPPAKWSFSSTVKTKSVLRLSIPCAFRRSKKAPKAWS